MLGHLLAADVERQHLPRLWLTTLFQECVQNDIDDVDKVEAKHEVGSTHDAVS